MKTLPLLLASALLLPASGQWIFNNARPQQPKKPTAAELQAQEMRVQQILQSIRTPDNGQLATATRQRLHDIFVKSDYRQQANDLQAWLDELMEKEFDSKVAAEEYAVLQALDNVAGSNKVRTNIFRRMLRTFANTKHVDNRELQEHLGRLMQWEDTEMTPYALCLVDAINGAWPRSANDLCSSAYLSRLGGGDITTEQIKAAMMLWDSPRDYAPLLLLNHFISYQDLTGKLLHDSDAPERILRHQGVLRWNYRWGRDLPATVDKALVLMSARRRGEMPSAEQVQELFEAAAPLPGDMRGFLPRCVLAADPAAVAWKTLDDEQASLYEMPDTTAVTLPQWKDELLGKVQDITAARAALEQELRAASAGKSLPALLAFSLVEDDLSLPDNAHRPWMNVDGYDSFRAVFDIDVSEDGTDVLVDEKGPHFSQKDPELRAAYRSLNLALHRYALIMACLERDGKTEELHAAADALAAILNTSKAWPLLWNQMSMRGVSPQAYLRLAAGYKGKPELLRTFADVVNCSIAVAELKVEGKPRTAENLLPMLREVMVCTGKMEASQEERAAVANRQVERERRFPTATGTLPSLRQPHQPEQILQAAQDADACYLKDYGLRALSTLRYALQQGDTATSERMIKLLTGRPSVWAYPTARLAAALVARHKGNMEEAAGWERDALALTAYHYGLVGSTERRLLMQILMHSGLVTEAERMNCLLHEQAGELRHQLAEHFAAQGRYGAAAYQMESLLHTAIRQSAPGNGHGSHRDVARWRTAADLYRAAYLRARGDTETADRLEQAARAAQPELAAAISLSAPAVQEDCSTPPAARREDSPFDSPYYTWHLAAEEDEDGPTVAEAKILNAAINPHSESGGWVYLRLRSGRTMSATMPHISTTDIGNLKDWMQRNDIRVYESRLRPGLPFIGKPIEMVQDKPFATRVPLPNGVKITNGKRVRFALMSGGYESHYTESLQPADRDALEAAMQPARGPETQLRLFDSYAAAEADASLNERSTLCLLLGKRGSELDQAFRAMPERSPDTVGEWNYFYSIFPCYQDEQGNWEPEAQRVLAYAHPLLEMMLPEGSAARERELQHGLAIVMDTAGYEGSRSTYSLHLRPRFVAPKACADERISEFYAAIKAKDAAKVEQMLEETPALAQEPLELEYTSPLFSAFFYGGPAIINSLLRHGADPNVLNKQMESALACALRYPANPTVIQALLDAGADLNARTFNNTDFTYQYPLHACYASVPCMQVLLGAGADPNLKDGKGEGVLFKVLQSPATVELLRRNGKADPNACNDAGVRPMGSQSIVPMPPCIDILLDWGADPYLPAVDSKQAKPAPRGATCEAAEFFSQKRERASDVPLFASGLAGAMFQEKLDVLLKHHIDFSYRFADGNEVLGYLIANGYAGSSFLKNLDVMIANGADIHATYNGVPLLYHLVSHGQGIPVENKSYAEQVIETFDALVARGLDPYAAYGEYENVFDYAESTYTTTDRYRRQTLPRATPQLQALLREWQSKHPKESKK